MKTLTVLLFLLLEGITGFAQGLSVGLSYNYLYSKQLDKCIQSYNFNRPFLENKQPLFIHGISSDIAYAFKNKQRLIHGLNANYSYFGSKATNQNLSNFLHLHMIHINYFLRIENEGKFKRLFEEINVGVSSSGLFRRINEEAFLVDGAKSKSLGIGGNIGLKVGYHLFQHQTHQLSPFAFLGYTPYMYAPKNESVINATQELITTPYFNVLVFRIGVMYEITKDKSDKKNTDSK